MLMLLGCTTLQASWLVTTLRRRTLSLRVKVPLLMTDPPCGTEVLTRPVSACVVLHRCLAWTLAVMLQWLCCACIVTMTLLSVVPLVCLLTLASAYLIRWVLFLIVVRSPVIVRFRLLR